MTTNLRKLAPHDLRGDWSSDRRLKGVTEGSTIRALQALSQLERHAGVEPHEVTKTQLRDWLADAKSLGGAAFNLRTVRPFFRWLVAEEIREDDPTAGVKVKVPDEPQRTATKEELEVMLKAARSDPRDHAIVSILIASGCRRSELGLATFGDARAHIAQGLFTIRHSKSMPRIVPLTAEAEKALRKWLRINTAASDTDNLWLVKQPAELVRKVVGRHSSHQLSPHAIRRHVVSDLARSGMSHASIGRLFGWSPATTGAMLSIYVKAVSQELMIDEFRRIRGS